MKFKLYTYDLWADQSNCNECASPKIDSGGKCENCESIDIHTSYSVNDVYGDNEVECETMEQAIALLELKLDVIKIDNNVDNEDTCYFTYISGKFNSSPACEIRRIES